MRLFLISSVRLSIILIFSAVTLAAQDSSERKPKKHYIGYGNLITNDLLGDGRDRWRTGSVSSSRIWGADWKGELPEEFYELVEIRIFGEIIAPSDLSGNKGIDRPYVSHVALGMQSHFQHNGLEYSTGIEASVLGKQTGLSDFQTAFHKVVGEQIPSETVLSRQIGNEVLFGPIVEIGETVPSGDRMSIRPFFEGYATAEILARVGADIHFGRGFSGALFVRDPVTGQRYCVIPGKVNQIGFSVGGDVGHVAKSAFFDDTSAPMYNRRLRFRTGVHWVGKHRQLFAGLTWLSKEFHGQPEAQILGSVRLILRF